MDRFIHNIYIFLNTLRMPELHCNELCFIHCFNMDLETAINVYT